ncbi:MAG TPA: hypothetical protein VHN74_07615 [Candidatus Angelobacter sp.]|jgi:hypothetical protein|nr:hypothetical protein [Candidatus Angelobacter sp.]
MRALLYSLALFFLCPLAFGQGTAPPGTEQLGTVQTNQNAGTPPDFHLTSKVTQMKALVKTQVNKAIMAPGCPNVENWRPLSTQEKFKVFLEHTYKPQTFASALVDTTVATLHPDAKAVEYETGVMGFGQKYGIALATSETDVFFERFLVPTVLKQDPRYFRNPELPFFKRAMYAMSRVAITRSDSGVDTFNASRVLGGAASQALSDLYVPGNRQGMWPIADRVTFDLVRDAGFNLLHEFWPDVRRKLFRK